ncbi:MAG: PAS domain S-box protein, partial [Bdellovibrionales bacterium]|nr:PAS domain S-box protein [Bdellovibrionales bacterium]
MKPSKKVILSAATLGAAAFLINLFSHWLIPNLSLPVGNLLLYASAIVFGIPGTMISVAAGIMPETLFTGDHLYGLRVLTLCGCISLTAKHYPRIPAYVPTLLCWFCVFAPIHFIFQEQSTFVIEYITLQALGEIFLVTIASSLLLAPSIWGALATHPKQVTAIEALTNTATLIGTGIGFIAVGFPYLLGTSLHLETILFVALVSSTLPGLIAWRLAHVLEDLPSKRLLSQSYRQNINTSSQSKWEHNPLTTRNHQKDMPRAAEEVSSPGPSYRSVAISLPDREEGVCAISTKGKVIFFNDTFREMVQCTDNEIAGHLLSELNMNDDVRKQIETCMSELTSSSLAQYSSEFRVNQLPDSLRFFLMTAEPFDGNDEEGFTLSFCDISERRTVETHLLQAQKMKSLGKVVAGIAHAFNNYLTNITGQASFAQRAEDSDIKEAAFKSILSSAKEAGELVWTLLDYAEGKPALFKKDDFGRFIETKLSMIRKGVGDTIEIQYQPPQTPIGVSCDENLILQLLNDLISNAQESYVDNSGTIHLSLDTEVIDAEVAQFYPGAHPGTYARLRVSDTGIGMSREVVARAFDPLFTTKQDKGQSGLGLSIVFAIVRAHDGFLSVESFPEKGTTISVYLPLVDLKDSTQTSRTDVQEKKDKLATETGEKILVVEDEPTVRSLVEKMLQTL